MMCVGDFKIAMETFILPCKEEAFKSGMWCTGKEYVIAY